MLHSPTRLLGGLAMPPKQLSPGLGARLVHLSRTLTLHDILTSVLHYCEPPLTDEPIERPINGTIGEPAMAYKAFSSGRSLTYKLTES